MQKDELKHHFHSTLLYIQVVFDNRFLKEWLKWNRLELTRGEKAILHEEEFDVWVNELIKNEEGTEQMKMEFEDHG